VNIRKIISIFGFQADHQKKKESYRNVALFLFALSSDTHAGSHSESGGDGGQYGDYDVQDFSPEVLVFHFLE